MSSLGIGRRWTKMIYSNILNLLIVVFLLLLPLLTFWPVLRSTEVLGYWNRPIRTAANYEGSIAPFC